MKRKESQDDDRVRCKRGNDDYYGRFDLQVRELCYQLRERTDHVIFAALGVIDLIVEFARPLIPLFAQIPPVLLTAMEKGGRYPPNENLDLAWQKSSPDWMKHGDIPVGSVFSSFEIGTQDEWVDCIVVVPASQCLPSSMSKHLHMQKKWMVGVIVPVVLPPQESLLQLEDENHVQPGMKFGADRTIFLADSGREEDNTVWQPFTKPADGWYAVHYIDVHCRLFSYWDHMRQEHVLTNGRPFLFRRSVSAPNPVNELLGHFHASHLADHRIHLLPYEVPYHEVEARLI